MFGQLFDMIGNIALPLVVCILIIILCIITFALVMAAKYYIRRIPEDQQNKQEYLSYREKANLCKIQMESYQNAIEDLRKQYFEEVSNLKNRVNEKELKDSLETELEALASKLDLANTSLFNTTQENVRKTSENNYLEKQLFDLKKQRDIIGKSIKESNADLEKTGQEIKKSKKELEELEKNSAKKIQELNKLNEDFKNLTVNKKTSSEQLKDLKDQIEKNKAEINLQENRMKDIEKIKNQLKGLEGDLQNKKRVVENYDREVAKSEIKLQELAAKNGALTEEINKHKADTELRNEGYANLMDPPYSLKNYAKKSPDSLGSESEELDKFENYLKSRGYYFSDRTIKSFHTSLKIQCYNPLTVLAGISGTGKTLLPTMYSEYFGIYNLVLPVEPRWDSPSDLMGFYNYLEKRYQATELSRSLVAFDNCNVFNNTPRLRSMDNQHISNTLKDRLFIVLLDEMNLARTEYYFSNFLSRLELRRNVNDKTLEEQRSNAEITIDDRFGKIWVPQNVLFVGTMNEDESTQTLSDKVLDRANLLRFGKPPKENFENQGNMGRSVQSHSALSYQQYKKWFKDTKSMLYEDFVEETIEDLNEAMATINKPFGYRVKNAIKAYVANYPGADENKEDVKFALVDQVEQKIMPKLRGLDLTASCLHMIGKILNNLGDNELNEAFEGACKDRNDTGMFMWQGVTRSRR